MNFSSLIPLVGQLGTYLKLALDQYALLKGAGESEIGPELVAGFLKPKMDSWNPKVGGKALLDEETRQAAARFLAGVAVNFSRE